MVKTFKKYSNFDRISTRSEYWGVILCMFGISVAVGLVAVLFTAMLGTFGAVIGFLGCVAAFVGIMWISIATVVARCRDAGINPWFTVACFIPYIGWIVTIVIGCLESKK